NTAQKSIKEDLLKGTSEEFIKQLFGQKEEKKYSGEIIPGETLELNEVYTGQRQQNEKLRKQISFERKLSSEQKNQSDKQLNELRIQLHALMQEVGELAKVTQNIGQDIEVASMQVTANPGVYHIVFFEKLLEFIKTFRRKIENADVWLQASNKRVNRKDFWGTFTSKRGGTKFLLSSEHYVSRSAG
ncbi:hypothetical protein KJ996_06480, partial [Patescibacteria group bacterium]|nr:hypothetical protein [Patescibacteria group bacterium]